MRQGKRARALGPGSTRAGASESGSFRFVDPGKRRWNFMKAEELDKAFDAGEDITEYLELSKARRPG